MKRISEWIRSREDRAIWLAFFVGIFVSSGGEDPLLLRALFIVAGVVVVERVLLSRRPNRPPPNDLLEMYGARPIQVGPLEHLNAARSRLVREMQASRPVVQGRGVSADEAAVRYWAFSFAVDVLDGIENAEVV